MVSCCLWGGIISSVLVSWLNCQCSPGSSVGSSGSDSKGRCIFVVAEYADMVWRLLTFVWSANCCLWVIMGICCNKDSVQKKKVYKSKPNMLPFPTLARNCKLETTNKYKILISVDCFLPSAWESRRKRVVANPLVSIKESVTSNELVLIIDDHNHYY